MRVAVVGTGSAGRRHLANFRQIGCDVVAVSEHRRRQQLTLDDGPVGVVNDFDAALARVDAVIVANPTSLHQGHVARAIEAGCHVLCEKPLTASPTTAAPLVELAAAKDRVLAVSNQFRFHPGLLRLKEAVETERLGSILDVEATQGEHLADYHPDEDYRQSYAARADLGGGVLLTQIHQIDFLHWLFGPFKRVSAVGGHRSDLEIDVEDTATYLLENGEGVAVRGHVDYLQRPRRMAMTVTGTEGRLHWDYYASQLDHCSGQGQTTVSDPIERNTLFVDLARDFVTAVAGGPSPRTTGTDALAVLQTVEAIKRSMAEGRTVDIAPADQSRTPR